MLELQRRNIYIIPSKTALGMMFMILLLFLLGVNFQNSLVYAVSFWLLALLLINIFYTWRNLAGLRLNVIGVEPCFTGGKAVLEVELTCPPEHHKFAIKLDWKGQDEIQANLANTTSTRIKLSHTTRQRGWFTPPRITVSSRFPTGLAFAWAYLQPTLRGLVYPRPIAHNLPTQGNTALENSEDGAEIPNGSSDFSGVRDYRPGDAPKHIHWGKYAQTGKLYTKSFVDYASHEVWLDWDSLPIPGIETRLSHLCSQVLTFHQAQRHYGLKLPGKVIPPGKGDAHKNQCLQALALYGITE